MNNQSSIKSEPGSLSLHDVVSAFFRHKLLIFVTFVTVTSGTGVVTFFMPNEYESRMRILVKNTRTDVPITPERTNGASVAASESSVSENEINSEIELLTSKDLLTQVAAECDLARSEPSITQRLGLSEVPKTQAAKVEEAANRLAKDLIIEPVKKASIIELRYSSTSPALAARVLNKVQELYFAKHLHLHRPAGTYEFFKTQADQYEQQLRKAAKELSAFQQSNNVVSLAQQKELTVLKLSDAKARLMETEALLKDVNERVEKGQQQLKAIAPRVVTQRRALPNQYSAERLNTMLVELQNRRTQLLTKFRPDDRLVREIDQQMRTTRAALDKAVQETATEQSTDLNPLRQLVETDLSRARVEQAGAAGRRGSLAGQVQQYEGQLSRLEAITAEYENLHRQVKQAEENYGLYDKKQEEARITDALDQNKITNVSVAEAAVQAQIPTKPNRLLNLLLGLFLGASLSVGSVFLAEFSRETVTTPRELEALTGQPILASLPRDRSGQRELATELHNLTQSKVVPSLRAVQVAEVRSRASAT